MTVLSLSGAEAAELRRLAFAEGTVVERDGSSLVAFGVARAIELPNGIADPEGRSAVRAALDGAGDGAVAVGALPFLPDAPGRLVIPELAVLCTNEERRAVVALTGDPRAVVDRWLERATLAGNSPAVPPDAFELESARPHSEFLARVAEAVEAVRSGRMEKVVLAREVMIRANRPFHQGDLLERLRSLHPSCATFAVDGFLGATPELLIRRVGDRLESAPLAGTAPRSGDPEMDRRIEAALLASEKERAEHRAVVDSIASALADVADLDIPSGPRIVELRNVSHLGTPIAGVLHRTAGGGDPPNALELVARIHPTPAVSGHPIPDALEYLAKTEHFDRDRYAGPVGWVGADGDGEFHLGIRSAIVGGATARLFAGVGIVSDSDPAAELRETQLKFQAVLAAAVRP